MYDFLMILLFSKVVLLTPEPVDINSNEKGYEINLKEPINAINSGASIEIDITTMLPVSIKGDVVKSREAVSKIFPDGSVEVILSMDKGNISLKDRFGISVGSNDTKLTLYNDNMPTNIDFNAVTIKTSVNLENVKIYWRNHTF